jgi:hypothetical protein
MAASAALRCLHHRLHHPDRPDLRDLGVLMLIATMSGQEDPTMWMLIGYIPRSRSSLRMRR